MDSLLYGLAAHPALPAHLVDRLIADADADAEVAWRLADRADLSRDQVRALAARSRQASIHLAYGGLLRAEDVDPALRPEAALALLDEGRGDVSWAPRLAGDPVVARRVGLAGCRGLPAAVEEVLAADREPEVVAELALWTASPALLTRLAVHPDAAVRRAAATNEATPPELLAALLDDDPGIRQAAVCNPATPGEAAARYADDPSPVLRQALAERPDLPAAVYERFAADPVPWVRGNLAENAAIGEPLIRRLAGDDTYDVRRRLAHHPHVPLDVLARLAAATRIGPTLLPRIATATADEVPRLAGSPVPALRMLLARRRDLPDAVRDALADDRDAKVAASIAPHPGLSERRLGALLDRFGTRVAAAVAANPGTPAALLERLAAQQPPAGKALRAVARHPHATAAALLRCLADPKARPLAAAHPALPADVLTGLLGGDDPQTVEAAAANPSLPAGQVESLLGKAVERRRSRS
ncbi:hypothetical protein [Streptomyces sp. CB01881]|uniref:hypothetical protein n=1 Tax=Streptomyces sp. CB01881 TaxID=2078691 RepID=UPI000CDC43ED|nr:hypothetical protein [Streptomyces sp. CB01881]AUY48562.1 hypothetical protein C2142_05870 [Streptomyces sp. CB01881]TYC77052.1 hypothetical protein EH183_05875 [Streptomyces sp. CB01881]